MSRSRAALLAEPEGAEIPKGAVGPESPEGVEGLQEAAGLVGGCSRGVLPPRMGRRPGASFGTFVVGVAASVIAAGIAGYFWPHRHDPCPEQPPCPECPACPAVEWERYDTLIS